MKYVHGDLKPTNILWGEMMEPYVLDFGLGRLANIAGESPDFGFLMSTSEMDIVIWVQLCMDEKKPFSDVVDPVLLRQKQMEEEMIGVFKIALQCVNINPQRRPSMRNVADLLDRLTCTG
uniref:Protein kinase domain-containing protein n=1 Tax=Nymphaea colorata TaxID=210225 RepID=A0A5K1DNT0_9MAGN